MDLMYAVYFMLGALIFCGAKVYRRGEWNEGSTSLEQTKILQGIAALGVALHHIAQKSCGPWHPSQYIVHGLDVFAPVGFLFVAVFLFGSGLGLYRSVKSKPGYLAGFFRRRIVPIVAAFYLSEIIYLIVRWAMGEKLDVLTVLWYLSGLHMANFNAWYPIVIVFFYAAFYLAFKKCRSDGAAIAWVACFTLMYTVLCAFIDHQNEWWFRGEWWYSSIVMFPLGLLFGRYESGITAFLKKKYLLWLFLSFAAMVGFYLFSDFIAPNLWGYYGETWHDPLKVPHRLLTALSQWLACIGFVGFITILTMKVRFGNRVLKLLGGVTLEFYLMHGIFVELFGFNFLDFAPSLYYIRNVPLYTAAVLICSIPATALFRFLWKSALKLPDRFRGRDVGNGSGKKERTGKRKKHLRAFLVPGLAVISLAVLYVIMGQGQSLKGREISGMLVDPPEGYTCTYADSRYAVWKNTSSPLKAGTLVLDAGIRDLNAQRLTTAEDVIRECEWLSGALIYTNPHGVRMAEGWCMEEEGSKDMRYYVESRGAVFLMSMLVNEKYCDAADCAQAIRLAADSVRPK